MSRGVGWIEEGAYHTYSLYIYIYIFKGGRVKKTLQNKLMSQLKLTVTVS